MAWTSPRSSDASVHVAMGDTWERVELTSARLPFRLKVAMVWVVLFALLAFFGNAAGFDTQWIRDDIRYIVGGLQYTMVIALSGIVLAIVLALLGALARFHATRWRTASRGSTSRSSAAPR